MLSLDHTGTIVHDLAAGAARWEALGFTLSPVSRQRGAVPGQEGMQPWASANRCAIFERGYLELIGLVDPAAHNPWAKFLDRFEGMHLLALRCAHADDAWELLAPKAPFLSPPVARERPLLVDGAPRVMRFRNIFSRDEACPEGRWIVIEHQTPEYLWQPSLTRHDNGARALEDVTVVTDDPAVAARIAALEGIPRLATPAAFSARFGWAPPSPAFAAVTVSFSDVEAAARLMETRGIEVHRQGADCWVGPASTNGFVLRMVPHAQA